MGKLIGFNKAKVTVLSIFALMVSAVSAFADPLTVDDMWAAVDLSGITEKVITLLIALIGLKLIFVAFGYARSALARARG